MIKYDLLSADTNLWLGTTQKPKYDNVQEWQRDTTELWSTDPKILYTKIEDHKTWLILTFVILGPPKNHALYIVPMPVRRNRSTETQN